MGRVATVPLSSLCPTQDYLDPKQVSRYMRAFSAGLDALLPVREPLDGETYELLDGHHAAVALYELGRTEARVWIAEHPHDHPGAVEAVGSVQADKLDEVCDRITERHMGAFGYVPTVSGVEITTLSALHAYAHKRGSKILSSR